MPLGTATQTITYFSLVDSTDMVECLHTLPDVNYRGDLSVWKDDTGADVWALVINEGTGTRPSQANLRAVIGDYVIWDNVNITIISAEDFAAHYTVVT